MNTATSLTLLGLAITAVILYANLRTWWKSSRDFKTLAPFATYFCFGGAMTMCAGGVLGFLAGCAAGATNTAGEKGVPKITGTGGGGTLASGTLGRLTPEGGVVVFIATAALVFAWRAAGKNVKKRMTGGAFCGATLCLTAGVAGLMQWLGPLINQGGATLRGIVESGL
ncbi:hypothetical protein ABZ820_34740 [Streptomyces diacarni]|uniref:hypothetical protein n=1 Tax=Streptomyces diacarni TaxID=2800381 RepID=UPI00340B32A8